LDCSDIILTNLHLELDNVVNREVTKFRTEFEGSIAKISTACNAETVEYTTNVKEYGYDDDRTINSMTKLTSCAVPLFCKSAMDELIKCADNGANIDKCHDQIESMIKCSVDKIYQPLMDFTFAAQNQSRSYEPLPPQTNPECKLNKKMK